MPLRLEIKKELSARSERVKCVDFHPSEPWILAALYSGQVFIWNYTTQSVVKSAVVCDLPVRCAKFIAKREWIVCGADDMHIRVYNYNTMERVHLFEAHTDYIRSLAVHPTQSLLLSSSDDMSIRLWDWEKGWELIQAFEGHTHYVMQVSRTRERGERTELT
jgi:coatomer subunit beta'